jgi:hypothetical protein
MHVKLPAVNAFLHSHERMASHFVYEFYSYYSLATIIGNHVGRQYR